MSKCLTNHALQCVEHFEHSNLKTPKIPQQGILGCVQESELMKILDDADDCILDGIQELKVLDESKTNHGL